MHRKLLGMFVLTSFVGVASADHHMKGAPPAAKPKADKPVTMTPPPLKPPPAATEAPSPMTTPTPGAETMALALLAGNGVWTGTMPANAMGPGTPELPTKGSSTCKWTLAKLWVQCTVKDSFGTGKTAMKNEGVLFVGWDFEAKAYRGAWIDTGGTVSLLQGKFEGSKLWLQTLGDHYTMMGQPSQFRLTWEWADPKAPTLTYEAAMGKGAKFNVIVKAAIKGLKLPKK